MSVEYYTLEYASELHGKEKKLKKGVKNLVDEKRKG